MQGEAKPVMRNDVHQNNGERLRSNQGWGQPLIYDLTPEKKLLIVDDGQDSVADLVVSCRRNNTPFIAIKIGRWQGGPSRTGRRGRIAEFVPPIGVWPTAKMPFDFWWRK